MRRFVLKFAYLLLSIYLAFGSLAHARAANHDAQVTTGTGQEVMKEKAARQEKSKQLEYGRAREKRGELQEAAKERQAEKRAKLSKQKKARILAFWNKMERRLTAAIKRQENLRDRVSARLDKIEKAGRNVDKLRVQLAEASESIKQARLALEGAKNKVDGLLSGNGDPKELFNDVKTLVGNVSERVKQAHAKLVDVISAIKKGRLDRTSGSATSTSN